MARHRRSDPLLARLGRSASRHRLAYLLTWVVLVALGFLTSLGLLGGDSLFDRLETGDIVAPGDAVVGRDLLTATEEGGYTVMLAVDGATLDDPDLDGAVRQLAAELAGEEGVTRVDTPMTTPGWPQTPEAYALVADGDPTSGTFLVVVHLADEFGGPAHDRVVDLLGERGTELLGPHAEELTVGGAALLVDDIVGQIQADLQTGEGIALPISLLVMVFVFGGLVAAGMPVVGAIASISGGLAILWGFSYVLELDATVVNIVTVMGLGLCIDYGLLIVSRFREEVARVAPGVAHRDLTDQQVEDAVAGALATAGRTVLFSGLIVGISLSGLLAFEAPIMRAIGAAGVSVVVVALLVALTMVPALCSLGARRLGRRRGAEAAPDHGVFSRIARVVQARPALATLLTVALLLFLAVPALGLRLTSSGTELLPPGAEQRQFFERLDTEFPALATPDVLVAAQATPEQAAAWEPELAALPGVESVTVQDLGDFPADVAAPGATEGGPGLVSIGLHTTGSATDDPAREVVQAVRDSDPGFPTWVTGQAASLADFTRSVLDRAPFAAVWIAGATFVLLFLLTGSVVIPAKALVLNVVSLGASLGILVWAFQHGHGESLLGFESTGGIESVIPLLVLAFGFGLSMDYEVFLLARIIELHEQGLDDDTAVRLGLQRSGRIITSAALIMVIVFAGFAAGQMLVIKQTGFALAVAVAIDATIVRMLVVPASMTLLGRWNWWAPAWLKRVHRRYGITEHSSPVTGPPPATVPPGTGPPTPSAPAEVG